MENISALDEYGVVLWESIISHLLWADDPFLVAPSADLMQSRLNKLNSYCGKWQLIVNAMKTKVIVFGVRGTKKLNFTFGGDTIETCESYSYLGNLVRDSRNPFTKIDEVILHKCYKACYKIRDYVESLGQLTPKLAVHLFNVPDHAVFGELGILPVSLRLKKNVLKYLHRLNAMPDSSPVKWAYQELISLHHMGFKNWYGKASELMQEFDESFLDMQGSHVKR